MTSIRAFCTLVDRLGEEVPLGEVQDARALYAAADDATRPAFLLRVASRLSRHLADESWDPVSHSAEIFAEWFLTPTAAVECPGRWRW